MKLNIKHVKNAAIKSIIDSVYLVYESTGPKCRVGASIANYLFVHGFVMTIPVVDVSNLPD